MGVALGDLEVLAIDCQASGATPAHGDLLEIGWGVCGGEGLRAQVHDHFVIPRTERRISAAVRELTGWSEACVAGALPEQEAWSALRADIAQVKAHSPRLERALAVIHFARFELVFLRDLHARLEPGTPFPLDAVCLHAISTRLFPDLPRRNIRALAGYLGHSTDLLRRCGSHVEASAAIWRALIPRLAQAGVRDLDELDAWLAQAPPRKTVAARARRVYPFALERRRALPDGPGVYRFLRSNGDLLYVGKAASIRKRVASHFAGKRPLNERALELLTQVQDIAVTETDSILEAALLESDEIKRLDPPYNVQLRSGERQAWFAARDGDDAIGVPDDAHRIGPLPSRRALSGLHALVALADGAVPAAGLQACALAVPIMFLPSDELFAAGWTAFAATHLDPTVVDPRARVERASRALWLLRGRTETDRVEEESAPDGWDLARVVRRLERNLIQTGLLVRRARWLCLLAHADVAFRERNMSSARVLRLARGELLDRHELASVEDLATLPARRLPATRERQACFDAGSYDRMRVLTTELNRVLSDGGTVALRVGRRSLSPARVAQLLRWV
jgi:predicted GIY-YIG superfamily endonuclease